MFVSATSVGPGLLTWPWASHSHWLALFRHLSKVGKALPHMAMRSPSYRAQNRDANLRRVCSVRADALARAETRGYSSTVQLSSNLQLPRGIQPTLYVCVTHVLVGVCQALPQTCRYFLANYGKKLRLCFRVVATVSGCCDHFGTYPRSYRCNYFACFPNPRAVVGTDGPGGRPPGGPQVGRPV